MEASNTGTAGMVWLSYVLLTVVCWGVYGVFLHTGATSMGDPAHGRLKAFLLVGVAYFVTAVLAPLVLLKLNGASWVFPTRGLAWSLIAGTVGAIGALGVLLAFGAKGSPTVVMSLIFAGAPIVNAIVALIWHPPAGGLAGLRWQFMLGIAMAAFGGYLVTLYKPTPPPPSQPVQTVEAPSVGSGRLGS